MVTEDNYGRCCAAREGRDGHMFNWLHSPSLEPEQWPDGIMVIRTNVPYVEIRTDVQYLDSMAGGNRKSLRHISTLPYHRKHLPSSCMPRPS